MADPSAHRILRRYELGELRANEAIRSLVSRADALTGELQRSRDDSESYERKYKRLKRGL